MSLRKQNPVHSSSFTQFAKIADPDVPPIMIKSLPMPFPLPLPPPSSFAKNKISAADINNNSSIDDDDAANPPKSKRAKYDHHFDGWVKGNGMELVFALSEQR